MSSFINPRLAALPCEMMCGCIFADNLITEDHSIDNCLTVTGAGAVFDRGVSLDGASRLTFASGFYLASDFTALIKFKTTQTQTGILFMTRDLINSVGRGFCIWVTPTAVCAQICDTAENRSAIAEVPFAYADNETHTATLTRDVNADTISLMVDGETVVTVDATGVDVEQSRTNIRLGGSTYGGLYTGSLFRPRLFNQALSVGDHMVYCADALTSFFDDALAVYRCDSVCDQTNYILDHTTNANDITKGDLSDASEYPTHANGRYRFDFANDFIGGVPELPSEFTVTAVTSTPYSFYPVVTQQNDDTLLRQLSEPGGFLGYLHSLSIIPYTLAPIQLKHAAYAHLYDESWGRVTNIHARLINEGTCKMSMFPGGTDRRFMNHASEYDHAQALNNLTLYGDDGVGFSSSNSALFVEDASRDIFNMPCGTIAIRGGFDAARVNGVLLSHEDSTESLRLNFANAYFFEVSKAIPSFPFSHLAVTWLHGNAPRLYIDGAYIGEMSAAIEPSTAGKDLYIGNSSALNLPSKYALQEIVVCDSALTDQEIEILCANSKQIGEASMEVGNRVLIGPTAFTGAVSITKIIGQAFQWIDVHFEFNTAPTTSEYIVLAVSDGANTRTQYRFDPSTSTSLHHPLRLDKRFVGDDQIKITYTNTDARSIKVWYSYQVDDSVA